MRSILLLVLLVALSGCEQKTQPATTAPTPAMPTASAPEPRPTPAPAHARSLPNQLPALYSGVLPCADCEGIRYELDLRADSVYFLRLTYLRKANPTIVYDLGQWAISDDDVLQLRGGAEIPTLFSVEDAGTLRKRDTNGRAIVSPLNYVLTRQDPYVALEPQLPLRGMYQYVADAAIFEECLSGLKLEVATEADNVALQEAYAKVRKQPGQIMLASVDGRIVRRPGADGTALHDALIVDRAGQFWPNESCGARGVTHDLESTRWVLVRLGDELVASGEGQREPYIALDSSEHRISGLGSCNRLVGGYELNGNKLTFTQLALTRMACPDMKYEDVFAKALNATATWKITGSHLELFDANGVVVARFEERNL